MTLHASKGMTGHSKGVTSNGEKVYPVMERNGRPSNGEPIFSGGRDKEYLDRISYLMEQVND